MSIDKGPLLGPMGGGGLMSEVPLYQGRRFPGDASGEPGGGKRVERLLCDKVVKFVAGV